LDPNYQVKLRTLSRWAKDTMSTNLLNVSERGAFIVDAGLYTVHVGDCSASGSALGLKDAYPCSQLSGGFSVNKTIVFNGKR
jgi:hypothetical protein